MIKMLCHEIKRNMYAYDDNDYCFENLIQYDSDHYSPLVFYKYTGHMYLINDKNTIRSIAESNKNTAKKIKTQLLDETPRNENNLIVYHLEEFNVKNAKAMEEGIYIINKSNITQETINFIQEYEEIPKTKNRDNVIVKFDYKNNENKAVSICVDANYGNDIEYNKIKKVAEYNEIKYINEGVGTVIQTILKNNYKVARGYLNPMERKAFIEKHENKCAKCDLFIDIKNIEIDHIIPIAAGGTNEIHNLQPLCLDCHKNKSIEEQKECSYEFHDETISSFNPIIWEKVMKSIYLKSYQFVEKVNEPNPKHDIFKIDMRKCRRNILYNSSYEFPVYSVMDIPKPYQGEEIQCGLYYVNTTEIFPFRGAGWYVEPLIKYGLDNDLISKDNIKFEFIPSKTLPNTHFKTVVDELLKALVKSQHYRN